MFISFRARGQLLEARLVIEPRDPLGGDGEVQLQRTFDGDLPVTKVSRRINLRELAFFEVAQNLQNLLARDRRGISRRLLPRLRRIGVQNVVALISWTLPLRSAVFAIRQHPHIGRNAGVVEELFG